MAALEAGALVNTVISMVSLSMMVGGIVYLLLMYRRTMRQYKLQMDQTVLEMKRQNDALEILLQQHATRLARLER
jgi:predicted histidine transporter YuiF (NhaC family)